jgi:hypothetical protein
VMKDASLWNRCPPQCDTRRFSLWEPDWELTHYHGVWPQLWSKLETAAQKLTSCVEIGAQNLLRNCCPKHPYNALLRTNSGWSCKINKLQTQNSPPPFFWPRAQFRWPSF